MSRHIQNPGIFNAVILIFKDDEAYAEPWHSQSSLFRYFQAYSGSCSNIQPCTGLLRNIKAYRDMLRHY